MWIFRGVFVGPCVCVCVCFDDFWFPVSSSRQCLFLQRCTCCIMNGQADNLQRSHSTLCNMLSLVHLTQHKPVTRVWAIETWRQKWGEEILSHCWFWNLWASLSSTAVRMSVFCGERKTGFGYLILEMLFYFIYIMITLVFLRKKMNIDSSVVTPLKSLFLGSQVMNQGTVGVSVPQFIPVSCIKRNVYLH